MVMYCDSCQGNSYECTNLHTHFESFASMVLPTNSDISPQVLENPITPFDLQTYSNLLARSSQLMRILSNCSQTLTLTHQLLFHLAIFFSVTELETEQSNNTTCVARLNLYLLLISTVLVQQNMSNSDTYTMIFCFIECNTYINIISKIIS